MQLELYDTLPVPSDHKSTIDKGVQKAQGAGRMDSIKKVSGERSENFRDIQTFAFSEKKKKKKEKGLQR